MQAEIRYERVAAGGRGVARSGSVASHREIRAKSAGAERRKRGFFEERSRGEWSASRKRKLVLFTAES